MSDQHIPFVERVLAGDVLDLSEIDDDIEAWHTSDTSKPLHEWLGMEHSEYALYVENASFLPYILQARALGQTVETILAIARLPALAARGASAAEIAQLTQWLRNTNRL